MDERTRRAIGFIAAFALIGGLVLGGFALLIFPKEEPAGTPAWLPPPNAERLEPDVEGRERDRAAAQRIFDEAERRTQERLQLLRQLDAVQREAEGLADEVRQMHREQEEFDRAADALERRIEKLER